MSKEKVHLREKVLAKGMIGLYLDYSVQGKRKLQLANSIKAQRELDIQSGKYGFNSKVKSKANFIEYFNKLTEKRFESEGNYGNWKSTLKHLIRYTSGKVCFNEIDEQFSENFRNIY